MENHSSGDSFWALCPSLSIRLRNLRPYVAASALMPIKQAADSSVNMIQSVKGLEGASCWGRVSGRPECCSPLAGPLGGLPDGGRGRSGGGGRAHAASVAEPHPPPWGRAARGVPSGTSGGRQPRRLLCLRAAGTGSVETAQAVPSGRASFESGSRAGAGRPCTAYLRPPTSGRGPKCGAWFCRWFLILFTTI